VANRLLARTDLLRVHTASATHAPGR